MPFGDPIDTSGAFITRVYRKTASDSVFYVKGGVHTFAFRDSIGVTGNFATANLTQTANRTYAGAGYNYTLNNLGNWTYNLASGKSFHILSPGGGTMFLGSIATEAAYLEIDDGFIELLASDPTGVYHSAIDLNGTSIDFSSISASGDNRFSASPDGVNINLSNGDFRIDSLKRFVDTASKYVLMRDPRTDSVKEISAATLLGMASGGSTPTLQQVLTAGATTSGDNTIVNGANTLTVTNNSLAGDYGVFLAATTTAAAGGTQKLLVVALDGANSNSGQSTTAAHFVNDHTGTTSTNIAGYFEATNGTTNKAIVVGDGDVEINNLSSFADTTNFKPVVINTTGTAGSANKIYKATYWPTGGGGGSGTVNSGAANHLAYYPSTGTTVDDIGGVTFDGNDLIVETYNASTAYNGLTLNNTYGAGIVSQIFKMGSNVYGSFFASSISASAYGIVQGMNFREDNGLDIGFATGTVGVMDGADLLIKASGDVIVQNNNLGLLTSSFGTSSVGVMAIGNGTAPGSSITDGVQLYAADVAASSELKVRDEAGNTTTLSPHHFTGIPGGRSEDLAWSYYSERDGKYINVDMAKAMRTIEDLSKRVNELEKKNNIKAKKPVKLVYTGSVKKQPNPKNK
jgi:hypothetical protein